MGIVGQYLLAGSTLNHATPLHLHDFDQSQQSVDLCLLCLILRGFMRTREKIFFKKKSKVKQTHTKNTSSISFLKKFPMIEVNTRNSKFQRI